MVVHALNCLDRNQLAELTSSVFGFCGSFLNLLTCLDQSCNDRERRSVEIHTLLSTMKRQCVVYMLTQLLSVLQS